MWSMPVVLTETENENDSVNQNYVAKITLQKWRHNDVVEETAVVLCTNPLIHCNVINWDIGLSLEEIS